MRLRHLFLGAIPFLALLVMPLDAHATGIPYWDSIVPAGVQKCAAGWAAFAQLINNLIAFVLTILIFILTPFLIVWAGFLYVIAPANPANRTKANHILMNTVVGIAIALFAWVIVNAVLTGITVYKDGSIGSVDKFVGAMFSTTQNACLLDESVISGPFSQAGGQAVTNQPWLSTSGPVDTGVSCPEGSVPAGEGCADTDKGVFVLPKGMECLSGTFDELTGGCKDSEGKITAPSETGDTDTPPPPPPTGGVPDGVFSYQPNIDKQAGDASGALSSLLSCMANKVPAGVGVISSISDSAIANGTKTFSQCAQGGCNHTAYSCHYGGKGCIGASYAVDFGDEQNGNTLRDAAKACNSSAYYLFEGNHVHISVGGSCGCN